MKNCGMKEEEGENMLAKFQMWLFEKGSTQEHFVYEMLGNLVQDVRTKLNAK
jgi:hypothetical protein